MNSRDRFWAVTRFEKADRLYRWEFGPYPETLKRWRREGMPEDTDWIFVGQYDRYETAPVNVAGLVPAFQVETVEETPEYEVYRDSDGVLKKKIRNLPPPAMPQYLDYPLTGRDNWDDFRRRLNPDSAIRFPLHWESIKKQYQSRDFPLGIHCGSLYGYLRNWMGVEGISYALHDDRAFVERAVEEMTDSTLAALEKALTGVQFDFGVFWEDMAYKTASLVSPRLYREIFLPQYRRITDRLRKAGIEINMLDSDGNVWELIPCWLDVGIQFIYPMEVASGMDVVKLRRKFGRELLVGGGMDKRVMASDKPSIKAMIEHVRPVIEEGGYVPGCDHAMPPDISYENYCYYRELLNQF